MNGIDRFKKWTAENVNLKYRGFLILFSCLMAAFLTSRLWLPNDARIENSAFGTERNTTDGVTLVLKDWEYNPGENYMEATFRIENSDGMQDEKFFPVAHTDTNRLTSLPVSVAYCNNGLLVIRFTNVPQKWNVVSLWIDGRDPDTDLASSLSSIPAAGEGANFLCDIRRVKINSSLKSQTKLFYSLQSIDSQITENKNQISKLDQKIDGANLEIKQLEFDISALKENQKYQTSDEIKESNSAIENKDSQIGNLKNDISGCQSEIKTRKEKLKKLQQKWNDTKSGRFMEPETSDSISSEKKVENQKKTG